MHLLLSAQRRVPVSSSEAESRNYIEIDGCSFCNRNHKSLQQRCHQALDPVFPTLTGQFNSQLRSRLRRKDPERPWQLIHISRATSIIQRSLINLKACIVTMILRSSNDMPSISYAWQELKEQLTESIDDKLNGMALLKGKPGVGFDVCAEAVTEIQVFSF